MYGEWKKCCRQFQMNTDNIVETKEVLDMTFKENPYKKNKYQHDK